jgi:hypothetical protein
MNETYMAVSIIYWQQWLMWYNAVHLMGTEYYLY